ncbi:SRPBCC family protein [Williamsia sterculiae]|uniref:Polyketide cyclase / dehydrase and lipid transport n=1 Tax=Williamsia sterculiae TaxID=1344003 RepID=A0A1N7FLL4_9NOCA|nr:SRPBCC family protein [Williamsia sterculiae]SIS01262.1 Polyketide cyclase / dehydrase and lipid transport [Williamsia sterculiae]
MSEDRIEVDRHIVAPPDEIFAVLTDPQGHVAIDGSGMLMSADGRRVATAGDSFVVHMDREALGDLPMGLYDVDVTILTLEPDREISWTVVGTVRPPIGHVYGYRLEPEGDGTRVTSFYDWSDIREDWRDKGVFPVVRPESLSATLGILARTVARGYPLATAR